MFSFSLEFLVATLHRLGFVRWKTDGNFNLNKEIHVWNNTRWLIHTELDCVKKKWGKKPKASNEFFSDDNDLTATALLLQFLTCVKFRKNFMNTLCKENDKSWTRTRISFGIIRATSICVRGNRRRFTTAETLITIQI